MNKGIKDYTLRLLQKGIRLDGRKLDEYRQPVLVEYGAAGNAEGSARVKIGETEVLAGIKLELGVPYPDTADQGALMVGVELLPMSNPEFEPGPPGIQSIELARVVDRGIRESHAIDMKKLCITPGEKCWVVVIDICPINDAGNLFDACALATLAALRDTVFPEVKDGVIVPKSKTKEKLPVVEDTLECTVYKIGQYFIVDPVTEEEQIYDGRLTIAMKADGTVCALQKGGEEGLSIDDISSMIEVAGEKIKMLREAL
ncbi:exosome complex protein Rrp42 [Candidatus Woesearchaeota archaeon]|nr:exosome complex protein Rrp42 [Candidatus Woesearchaeota archaeon]MBW3021901.1 exosome complex protein Rrp42 [Candidatus Woesearchaeota archaeon]